MASACGATLARAASAPRTPRPANGPAASATLLRVRAEQGGHELVAVAARAGEQPLKTGGGLRLGLAAAAPAVRVGRRRLRSPKPELCRRPAELPISVCYVRAVCAEARRVRDRRAR